MDFLKRNWWKLLPILLFFFGVAGIIAFIALLIMYSAFQTASALPVNTKRGKLLTWLIILEVLTLVTAIVSGLATHTLGWISSVLISLEAVCIAGIWKWKKVAAIGLVGLLIVHHTKTSVQTTFGHHYPAILTESTSLWLLLTTTIVWLGLWIKALRRKWSMFT